LVRFFGSRKVDLKEKSMYLCQNGGRKMDRMKAIFQFLIWAVFMLVMTAVSFVILPLLLLIERIRDGNERKRSAKQRLGKTLISRNGK